MTKVRPNESLLRALVDIEQALAENIHRSTEVRKRVQHYRSSLENGANIRDLILDEVEPRTVALLTENLTMLENVGSAFRFRLAKSLRDDGMTIAAIADLFGVTRQRISALLRQG